MATPTTPVPMSHPATVVKNPDGTYSVRIQHTAGGIVTNVDFTNVLFAETLANAYAAMLNGSVVIDAKITQFVTDAKPALAEAQVDLSRLVTAAEGEAKNIIAAAKLEAAELKTEAETLAKELKAEAVLLLEQAKTEAAKLLHAAAAKIEPTPAPKGSGPLEGTKNPKPPVVEDEN